MGKTDQQIITEQHLQLVYISDGLHFCAFFIAVMPRNSLAPLSYLRTVILVSIFPLLCG
jgi:hypothetical protein